MSTVYNNMIRKISHIFISAMLLILTMGFTVSQHYCGEQMVDVSLLTNYHADSSGDDSCDMNDMSCCHNEQHLYQLTENFTQPAIADHVQFIQVDLLVFDSLMNMNLPVHESENEIFSYAESPPPPDLSTYLSSIQIYRL